MMKLWCFGDSNTYGYDPCGFFGGRYAAPWPALLAEMIGFQVINDGKNGRTDRAGQRFYDCRLPDPLKGEQIPYWYAFWETPQPSGYGPDDFRRVNSILFPAGTDELEVYEWTTDWSNYFDDGHEWWGTACWSIYDGRKHRYIVIMASTTD